MRLADLVIVRVGQLAASLLGLGLGFERPGKTTASYPEFPDAELATEQDRDDRDFVAVDVAGDSVEDVTLVGTGNEGRVGLLDLRRQCLNNVHAGNGHVIAGDVLAALVALLEPFRSFIGDCNCG